MRWIPIAWLLCGCNLVLDLEGCPAGGCAPDADPPPSACVEAEEVCNGVDDDCDEQVDEGTAATCYDGPPETEGVAACQGGLARCTAAPGSGAPRYGPCEGQTLPAAEACNGVDDDCDGEVDRSEGGAVIQACYPFDEGEPGVGACAAGAATCADGAFGLCEGAVGPREEVADGVDDDCDGAVDEG